MSVPFGKALIIRQRLPVKRVQQVFQNPAHTLLDPHVMQFELHVCP